MGDACSGIWFWARIMGVWRESWPLKRPGRNASIESYRLVALAARTSYRVYDTQLQATTHE
jgi:hypothetical protein